VTLRLHTLGNLHLTRDGEPLSGAAGQRRLLAILTILAAVGERGLSRDKVLGLLWAEGDPDKSRHALTQSLYHIRKALGGEKIFASGSDLRLDPALVTSDVGDFQLAIAERRFADAVALYGGPFLDGFHLNGNPEFDFWVSSERDRYARQFSSAVLALADESARAGDSAVELQWLERLADHDPLDGGVIARYMRCLIAAGDHSAALRRARSYKTRLREELDLPPDRGVMELVSELKRNAQAKARAPENLSNEAPTESPAIGPSPVSADLSQVPDSVPVQARVGWWRTAAWISAAAAVAFAAVATRAAASRDAGNRTAVRETIMIAPFRVSSTEPASAYLREGLLDLLAARLTEPDEKRATDPALVLKAWKGAGFAPDSAVSVESAAQIARGLDAGEFVIGSVLSANGGVGVKIHASLVDVATNRVKAAVDVNGSPDSLMTLTDRIVNGLILTEAGERGGGYAQSAPVSPQALRAFLAGRAAYRRDDYYGAMRAYDQALAHEPNFARAALGLAMSADHVNSAEQHDRGLAVAWARQRDLSVGDREYLRAFAGPRYPEPSSAQEALAAWEQAVRVAPDRPEGWHSLGESFYYDAEMIGLHDGPVRAAEAFRRALKLDSSFAPSRRMLTLLLARNGDTASLRSMLARGDRDTDDSMSVFVRWRVANALSDSRELSRVRRAFDDAPNAALRSIAMTSQFDGVSIDDGDRALAILRKRPLTDAEEIDLALANHSRALNSADVPRAYAITEELGRRQPALHPQLRLRVLDGLYSNVDRAGAAAAAARLEAILSSTTPYTLADSAVRLADVCVLAQWRLASHDTAAARVAVRTLRAGVASRFPVPVGASPMTCAELIDVSLAVAERGAGARDRLAHLDSLMLSGPAVSDAMRYANLIVARHYQALGDPAHALAALRRRSYMRGWPRYRATGLQLQVDLALQLGDSAAARSAYQRLMATRRPPVVAEASPPLVTRLRRFSRRLVQ
jgi:DNA-binding SARP family transcriptional activator/Tfp pilus assembly protein PilF